MNHHEIDEMIKSDSMSEDQREWYKEHMRNWRSWGSWFSWGSPVGFGLFIISTGVFLLLLHYAGLVR